MVLSRTLKCLGMSFRAETGKEAMTTGMVGTLVGLINMLKAMDVESGGGNLGPAMATALVTTLYGCVLAHMLFGPIATQLRQRDEGCCPQ